MSIYIKLMKKGAEEPPALHFTTVMRNLIRVLGPVPDLATLEGADLYAEKYLAYNVNRKAVNPPDTKVDEEKRKAETLTGFLQRELVNRKINETDSFGYNPATDEFEPRGDLGLELLNRARQHVFAILGTTVPVDRLVQEAAFGSGASATLPRKQAASITKYERSISSTRGLAELAINMVATSPAWSTASKIAKSDVWYTDTSGKVSYFGPQSLKILSGAVMDFVRKTIEIDRIILKEPEFNGYIQKGTGKYFRKRLDTCAGATPLIGGVCLNTSGNLNNEHALIGSVDGSIATVDAERASDSITIALCEYLLPPKWFEWLMLIRSPYVVLPNGKLHRLQMMAGMGNGFCFELESILFYAIGLACAEKSKQPFAEAYVSIHGDDLIVPADVFDYVCIAYERAGIVVNKSKSFSQGPFRESCGGHYFAGQSVKPFFRKGSNGFVRGDWFWFANSLLEWLSERSDHYLASNKGRDLIDIMLYLRWYASSGDSRWRTCHTRGRRTGLYSEPLSCGGPWYKAREVVADSVKVNASDASAYAAWLQYPTVSPTVLEILTRDDSHSDAYRFVEETIERERNRLFTTWSPLPEAMSRSSLWTCDSNHKLSDL